MRQERRRRHAAPPRPSNPARWRRAHEFQSDLTAVGDQDQCDAEGCGKMGKQILRQIHANQIDLSRLNSFKGEVYTMMGRLVMQVYSRLIGNDHHCCAFHGRSNMPYWCLIGLFAICLCASSMKAVCWNRSHSCLQQKRTMFLRNTLRASPRSPLPGRLSNWKSFIRFLNQTKMDWHWYEDCQTNRSTKIGQTNNTCFSSVLEQHLSTSTSAIRQIVSMCTDELALIISTSSSMRNWNLHLANTQGSLRETPPTGSNQPDISFQHSSQSV